MEKCQIDTKQYRLEVKKWRNWQGKLKTSKKNSRLTGIKATNRKHLRRTKGILESAVRDGKLLMIQKGRIIQRY